MCSSTFFSLGSRADGFAILAAHSGSAYPAWRSSWGAAGLGEARRGRQCIWREGVRWRRSSAAVRRICRDSADSVVACPTVPLFFNFSYDRTTRNLLSPPRHTLRLHLKTRYLRNSLFNFLALTCHPKDVHVRHSFPCDDLWRIPLRLRRRNHRRLPSGV